MSDIHKALEEQEIFLNDAVRRSGRGRRLLSNAQKVKTNKHYCISNPERSQFGTMTVISPNLVLTAAHNRLASWLGDDFIEFGDNVVAMVESNYYFMNQYLLTLS